MDFRGFPFHALRCIRLRAGPCATPFFRRVLRGARFTSLQHRQQLIRVKREW